MSRFLNDVIFARYHNLSSLLIIYYAKSWPNGSGKSTLFNVITGLVEAEEGSIRFYGDEIMGLADYQILEKGIALPDDSWDWNKYREVALKIAEPDNKKWAREDVGSGAHRRFHLTERR